MTDKKTLLDKESSSNTLLTILLVIGIVSGFGSYLLSGSGDSQQWMWLVHSLVGLALGVQLLPYLFVHVQRTLTLRRWNMVSSGSLLVVSMLVLILTGAILIFIGQKEQDPWVIVYHVYAAFCFLLLFVLHLVIHVITLGKKRKVLNNPTFSTYSRRLPIQIVISVLAIFIVASLLHFSVDSFKQPYSIQPAMEDYEYPYGSHPFRPSQTETWHGEFVDTRQIAISSDCATCHSDIANEWTSSVHKQAASDITYVTNISLLVDSKGIAAARYCEGCHAPIALLTGELSAGGQHAGIDGTPANLEGVGCMGCHGIERAVHLDGVASYEFKAKQDYLFGGLNSPIATDLRHFLIRLQPNQHKADLAKPVLSSPTLCATCHAQFMDKDMNDWGWVKMQDEYSAWLNGPFSQQHQQTFSNTEAVRCQDCHMPLVDGTDPSANKQGKHRSHRFLGANTVLPLLAGDEEQLRMTKEFLQQNKMRISIEEPRRRDATQDLQALDESLRTNSQTPYYVYIGEEVSIKIIISNIGVGHNFPGGTLDLNEAWVSFTVADASGQFIYQSGAIQPDNSVDPEAHFYRSRPIDREGNLVWKHDLFSRVGEAYKDFVPAGKSDVLVYSFHVPNWAKGPLVISATLKYRKLNERYARWALGDEYQPIPIIDVARDSLAVPLKIKRELGF